MDQHEPSMHLAIITINSNTEWMKNHRSQPLKTHLKEKESKYCSYDWCREPVDKIYFRRRDEQSDYSECLFKSKVIYRVSEYVGCAKQEMISI